MSSSGGEGPRSPDPSGPPAARAGRLEVLQRSVLAIPKVDCAAEERMVRLALAGVPGVERMSFDLPARRLTLLHRGPAAALVSSLAPLGFGARLLENGRVEPAEEATALEPAREGSEAGTLWLLLAINALLFVVEAVAGWRAQSTGLLSDALDMFADAAVYGLALGAVGRSARLKLRAARASGALQLLLALLALSEVTRRALAGSRPEPPAMIGVALLALAGNAACLVLAARHRHAGVHMRASYIFSANDVLANLGVIAAGALVAWTGSRVPDLVIGGLIALVVLRGAVRILRLR